MQPRLLLGSKASVEVTPCVVRIGSSGIIDHHTIEYTKTCINTIGRRPSIVGGFATMIGCRDVSTDLPCWCPCDGHDGTRSGAHLVFDTSWGFFGGGSGFLGGPGSWWVKRTPNQNRTSSSSTPPYKSNNLHASKISEHQVVHWGQKPIKPHASKKNLTKSKYPKLQVLCP